MGALIGAAGVALAAYASHASAETSLAVPAAAILLAHAPTLLAISVMIDRRPRAMGVIALVMVLGVSLFSGDLACRIWLGTRLFEGAAPIGGSLIILSWFLIAFEALLSAVFDLRKRRKFKPGHTRNEGRSAS